MINSVLEKNDPGSSVRMMTRGSDQVQNSRPKTLLKPCLPEFTGMKLK